MAEPVLQALAGAVREAVALRLALLLRVGAAVAEAVGGGEVEPEALAVGHQVAGEEVEGVEEGVEKKGVARALPLPTALALAASVAAALRLAVGEDDRVAGMGVAVPLPRPLDVAEKEEERVPEGVGSAVCVAVFVAFSS